MLHSEKLNAKAKAFLGLNHQALENTVLATIINKKVYDVESMISIPLSVPFLIQA